MVIALFEGLGVFRWVNTLTACLFSLSFWPVHSSGRNIPDLDLVRREIEHMRIQVGASERRFTLFCFGGELSTQLATISECRYR